MSAARLLDRLDRVRQTGSGRWIARCPAHEDRGPSLSIREIDGRTLLHCFAGCGTLDVLDALGLEWSALFEERSQDVRPRSTSASVPAPDLLHVLDHEIIVATLILDDVLRGRSVSESQVQRLCQAAARIGKARDIVNPAKVGNYAA